MRRQLSARTLILDEVGRVLLFRFVYKRGPLAGHDFCGGVEDGETLEQAALRELVEETGLRRESVGREIMVEHRWWSLLTGLTGGAIATHLRLDHPLFSHTLFGVYLGLYLWGGLWLRDERLRRLLPISRP